MERTGKPRHRLEWSELGSRDIDGKADWLRERERANQARRVKEQRGLNHKLRREGERVARGESVVAISEVTRKAFRRQLHRLVRPHGEFARKRAPGSSRLDQSSARRIAVILPAKDAASRGSLALNTPSTRT